MEPSEYENIARVEAVHWWYRGMAAISFKILSAHLAGGSIALTQARPPRRILDAGCGPGGTLPQLAAFGAPLGLDFHPLAIAYAQGRQIPAFPLLRGSVTQLPLRAGIFDLVVSFDVLYHRAVTDDRLALAEFWRVLRPGGLLLIRLPALESLRGAHDVVVHTRRRYTRADLAAKLRGAGFQIHRLTYANTLLLPFVVFRRKLAGPQAASVSDVALPAPILNWFLEWVLRLESLWLSWMDLPIGVSLLALAAKPATAH